MRDPERIPIILDLIKHKWEKNPDLRFGQFIWNLLSGIWDTTEPRFFYLDDGTLEDILLGPPYDVEDEEDELV